MTSRLLSVVVAALLAPATAAAQAPAIQPGDRAFVGGGCSLGWLFDGSDGGAYFSIAAHCGSPGEEVRIADPAAPDAPGELLGKVALRGSDGPDPGLDVALIRVRDEMRHRVAGELRGHPDIPTGVITPQEAATGDPLQMSSWGTGFNTTQQTREQRQGIFFTGDALSWEALLPQTGGDSGGPVAHVATGRALGIHKGGRCGVSAYPCAQFGPTVAALEALAAKSGLRLALRAAGAKAPPPPPQQPPAQPQPKPQPPVAQPAPAAAKKKPSAKAACQKKAKKVKNKRKRKAALKRCAKKR